MKYSGGFCVGICKYPMYYLRDLAICRLVSIGVWGPIPRG